VYPFPVSKTHEILRKSKKMICVEVNATGQFARLFESETGIKIRENILRYDGKPFTPDFILSALDEKGMV